MQGKLTLAVGFVAGYVLGSKAGRQRYEETVSQARKVAGNQTVQSTAGVLQAQASDLVNKAKQSDLVGKAKQTVGRSGSSTDDRSDNGTVTTTYTTPSTATYTAPAATYTSESESFSTSSPSGTDLFEPSSSTTDPLTTADPLTASDPLTSSDPLATSDPLDSDPLSGTTDPLRPTNESRSNGSNI